MNSKRSISTPEDSGDFTTVKAGAASAYWNGTVFGEKTCQPECDALPRRE